MGNFFTKNNDDNDSLHWDNYNTEDMSSVVPQYRPSQNVLDANQLITNLKLPTFATTDDESLIGGEEEQPGNQDDTNVTSSYAGSLNSFLDSTTSYYNNVDENGEQQLNNVDEENVTKSSNTSPFISSEMYTYIMKGGGSPSDSSTSTTSTTDKKKDDKKSKHTGSTSLKSLSTLSSSNSNMSYVSSSAHTGGAFSDVNDESSVNETTMSELSNNQRILSSSLNTSDINLIPVE